MAGGARYRGSGSYSRMLIKVSGGGGGQTKKYGATKCAASRFADTHDALASLRLQEGEELASGTSLLTPWASIGS